jgi:hypothetical protein
MKRTIVVLVWMVTVIAFEGVSWSQSPAGPAGHWEGAIETPGQPLQIEVDLAARAGGNWEGTITIPAQNLKAFPLRDIAVQDSAVRFAMKGVPGEPEFKGTISKDAKSISGQFSQGGALMPFSLTWKGEATIEAPPKSTAIGKDFEGAWDGVLNAGGTVLRLTLKLANQQDGAATGSIISVDQGGAEIPITAITQTASHLKFVVSAITASYEGDLKDRQITGTWAQGPNTLPLVFSRPK